MRLATLAFMVIAPFAGVMAQNNVGDPGSNKKALEKDLIKFAPYVYDVDIDGCELTIKIASSPSRYFSVGPSSFPGGAFPRDDSSASFTAGPGTETRFSNSSSRFLLRLSDLNVEDVTVIPPFRRDLSTIKINGDIGGAIGVLRKGVVTPKPEFTVVVKQKAALKTANTFRNLISQCKNPS